jgi:flagellar capping protein FliD
MKQFTRLDTLLSSLSATSAYLSQQIDSLPSWSPN